MVTLYTPMKVLFHVYKIVKSLVATLWITKASGKFVKVIDVLKPQLGFWMKEYGPNEIND